MPTLHLALTPPVRPATARADMPPCRGSRAGGLRRPERNKTEGCRLTLSGGEHSPRGLPPWPAATGTRHGQPERPTRNSREGMDWGKYVIGPRSGRPIADQQRARSLARAPQIARSREAHAGGVRVCGTGPRPRSGTSRESSLFFSRGLRSTGTWAGGGASDRPASAEIFRGRIYGLRI